MISVDDGHSEDCDVNVPCPDIKTLDIGKRNLVKTVTTVKRLQMLMAGADQLGDMIQHHQYRPAARLLQVSAVSAWQHNDFRFQ